MKWLVLLTLFFNNAYANCLLNFTQGTDSSYYQMRVDLEPRFLHEMAQEALGQLVETLRCGDVKITDFVCASLIKGQPESEVCYVRSDIGYFILHKNYMDTVNITYNRFD